MQEHDRMTGLWLPRVAVDLDERARKYRCSWISARGRAKALRRENTVLRQAISAASEHLHKTAAEHRNAASTSGTKVGVDDLQDVTVAYSVAYDLERAREKLEDILDEASGPPERERE